MQEQPFRPAAPGCEDDGGVRFGQDKRGPEREVEFLPNSEEMFERRANAQGMVRPELAVLLAYAKRSIAAELLASDLPDSEYLENDDLMRYFPPAIVERFGHLIHEHPLKRTMDVEKRSDFRLLTFTDAHLARGIAEALRHAYQGEVDLRYTRDDVVLRATWTR